MKKTDRRGGSRNNSANSSRNSSRQNSPGRMAADVGDDAEVWVCHICDTSFTDQNAKLLECQRCSEHFCIKCLNKSESEYNAASSSDLMWFCVECRLKVQKNIKIDIDIEKKCNEIMLKYESRIEKIEKDLETKCDKSQVRNIVNEEMDRVNKTTAQATNSTQHVDTDTIIGEIEERKSREKNIVIYGIEEMDSTSTEERIEHDTTTVERIFDCCEVEHDRNDITKVKRIGKHDKNKKSRPMIVSLRSLELKKKLMKNLRKLKENGLENVRISNDLTKAERENENKLYAEARQLEKESGEYQFRVRGPPWDRKLVKIPRR